MVCAVHLCVWLCLSPEPVGYAGLSPRYLSTRQLPSRSFDSLLTPTPDMPKPLHGFRTKQELQDRLDTSNAKIRNCFEAITATSYRCKTCHGAYAKTKNSNRKASTGTPFTVGPKGNVVHDALEHVEGDSHIELVRKGFKIQPSVHSFAVPS